MLAVQGYIRYMLLCMCHEYLEDVHGRRGIWIRRAWYNTSLRYSLVCYAGTSVELTSLFTVDTIWGVSSWWHMD